MFRQKLAQSPELSAWWSGRGADVGPCSKSCAPPANTWATRSPSWSSPRPMARPHDASGLLRRSRSATGSPNSSEAGHCRLITSKRATAWWPSAPSRAAVESARRRARCARRRFPATPLLCAHRGSLPRRRRPAGVRRSLAHWQHQPFAAAGVRYFIAEEKEVNHQMEARATLGFDGPRTGIAAWLADPAPMGSLDYVSPDATFVAAFVVKNPGAIVDQVQQLVDQLPMVASKTRERRSPAGRRRCAQRSGGQPGRRVLRSSLDGPPFPVPSWKLVTEVYDPVACRPTLHKLVAGPQRAGRQDRRASRCAPPQETVDGQTYYTDRQQRSAQSRSPKRTTPSPMAT